MFIRPAPVPAGMAEAGFGPRYTVRDPLTFQPLDTAGEEKPDSEYWLRRLTEGGVEIAQAPHEESAP